MEPGVVSQRIPTKIIWIYQAEARTQAFRHVEDPKEMPIPILLYLSRQNPGPLEYTKDRRKDQEHLDLWNRGVPTKIIWIY